MTKNYKAVLILFIITIFTGCSSINSQPLPVEESKDNTTYLIGSGDQLQIFVWRNKDLSTRVTVRPDGRISSPLIDDLVVAGLEPNDVAVLVEDILGKYIRDPQVSIIVSGFKGTPAQQVKVIGNATDPKVIPYSEGMTLLDVMIAVKGLTDFADGDNAQLVRTIDGEQKQYTVFLDSLIRKGDISKNRSIHPGDTIIIPEAWF
ncbi:MAG: polysaccharide biosynthesis/export family protein [Gammaproteobacteria bacterium]|nr:polysaccharide biosynthesis/export family protein [Gammaproteobacteria bacterium]